MTKKKHKNESVVMNEDNVSVDSFKSYKSSDDGKTKIVNGEKELEDFHLYKEEEK